MRVRPVRPARSLKTQYANAAIVVALTIVLSTTGFVWATTDVTVVVDGTPRQISTGAETVAEALAAAGIAVGQGDLVTPSADSPLPDAGTIVVRRSVPVSVVADGTARDIAVVGATVADALVAAGVDLDESAHVSPALDAPLVPGLVISVPTVFTRVSREVIDVPFKTVVRKDRSLPSGTRVVKAQGSAGRTLKVWETTVVDGKPDARSLAAAEVLSAPKQRVVLVGTGVSAKRADPRPEAVASKPTSAKTSPKPAAASAKAPRGRRMTVVSTAYSPAEPGLSSRTATGRRATKGVIAVDPRVIPLGTRVYVPGYGYAVAADTGGAIDGRRIDVCFDTVAEAMAWGRRTVTITILD